ncbi:MAG: hypothetical protein OHK0019_00250 [Saprospiraceae bacterium]
MIGLRRVLRRDALYLMFWAFATSRRDHNPGESWYETARAFKVRFCLDIEEIQEETLVRQCQRMTADFINEGI